MIKVNYLEQPTEIPLTYLTKVKGERTFKVAEDIEVMLSDGYIITIFADYETDLASVPNWAWSIFKPIDKAFIGDLIHDYLWSTKVVQLKRFDDNIYEARKFADKERYMWRKAIAPKKWFKNWLTYVIIRLVGGFFYSKQLKIPN